MLADRFSSDSFGSVQVCKHVFKSSFSLDKCISTTSVYPVDIAEFRTHEINFDAIMKTVRGMISRSPPEERMSVLTEWDRLRDNMENIQRRISTIPKMDIRNFPKLLVDELPPLEDALLENLGESENVISISGRLCDEVVEEGDLEEIIAGTDVAGVFIFSGLIVLGYPLYFITKVSYIYPQLSMK